jgi:hypothetical protein
VLKTAEFAAEARPMGEKDDTGLPDPLKTRDI